MAVKKTRKADIAPSHLILKKVRPIGSDHDTWEVRRGTYVCGRIVRFDINEGLEPYSANGRAYGLGPMGHIGYFRSVEAAADAIARMK